MSNENSLENIVPKMRDELEKGKHVEFETHGFSMVPLLHDGGDKVVLCAPDGRLKLGDVAFCKTSSGKYVLHRVVGFDSASYILRGDNSVNTEICLNDDDVVGKACAFIRCGKSIDTDSLRYKMYCRFMRQILFVWRSFWKCVDRHFSHKQ